MVNLSVCIEMFWLDETDPAAKVRNVKEAGIGAYEFWAWSNKDVDAVAEAQTETGLTCAGHLLEPPFALTARETEQALVEGVSKSAAIAERLGSPGMIVTTGNILADEAWDITLRRVVRRLKVLSAVAADHGLKIYLEPLNPVVDHHGYWLTTMAQAADIVAEVNSPALTILYDIYHQQITEGNLISNLRTYLPLIGHIHTAGVPGRHELADNEIDYRAVFKAIDESDYAGYVGLEFRPSLTEAEALAQAVRIAEEAV
jgi:hydroxypyruvate isomerase